MEFESSMNGGDTVLCHFFSSVLDYFESAVIRVETYLGQGLPCVRLVGLPDMMVKESIDRVHSAIRSSQFEFPLGKLVINLSPSDLKKEGTHLDLPVALSILGVTGQINGTDRSLWNQIAIFGELSLSGTLLPVTSIVPLCLGLSKHQIRYVMIPVDNLKEVSQIPGLIPIPVQNLNEAVQWLTNGVKTLKNQTLEECMNGNSSADHLDYSEVYGQEEAKKILLIAASGGHHTLLVGPPGAGKTMLVKRMGTIMPKLSQEQALAVASIHGMTNSKRLPMDLTPPVRTPHYSISVPAFVGGYSRFMPGEVSLSHHGVLFMDEFPEYQRMVIESLRTILDESKLTMKRAQRIIEVPCEFLLIAAANPCPCGYYGSKVPCTCKGGAHQRYLSKMSGPILDRFDLRYAVQMPSQLISMKDQSATEGLSSSQMANRVIEARKVQLLRNDHNGACLNGSLSGRQIKDLCILDELGDKLLSKALSRECVSLRGRDKILRISRTIADLNQEERIPAEAVAEALSYHLGLSWK